MTESGILFQSDRSADDIQIYSDISLFIRSIQLNIVDWNRTECGACDEGRVMDGKRSRGILDTTVENNWHELQGHELRIVNTQLKYDGTRWRTGGEVKGKVANGVGSQCSSHYLGTWCIPTLLPLMRTLRLPVVDGTEAPADLNGLVVFAERRNLVSGRVPPHFRRSLLTKPRDLFLWEGERVLLTRVSHIAVVWLQRGDHNSGETQRHPVPQE